MLIFTFFPLEFVMVVLLFVYPSSRRSPVLLFSEPHLDVTVLFFWPIMTILQLSLPFLGDGVFLLV